MFSFSWQSNWTERTQQWVASTVFVLVGILCGAVLPWVFAPQMPENAIRVEGMVARYESLEEGDSLHTVFAYTLQDGSSHSYTSPIGSNRPTYAVGDKVMLIIDPAHLDAVFVEGDKDLAVAVLLLRILGGVFLVLGAVVLIMLLRGMATATIRNVGGLLGALSFGIPATFVLPGLWWAYTARPNMLFRAEDAFTGEMWFIGILFSVLGVITTILTLLLYRYQARTGLPGWSWSWDSTRSMRK